MLHPGTFSLTLLLSFLTALGPLTMDMYLPSLPAIGQALDASTVQVQLTISSYLIGFACGQIIYGPVSDRIGRRAGILAGLGVLCRGLRRLRHRAIDPRVDRGAFRAGARRCRLHRAGARRGA